MPAKGAADLAAPSVPTMNVFGRRVPIKYLSLVILVLQNSSLVLCMKYSRLPKADGDGPLYLGSVAVVFAELTKLLTCMCIIAQQSGGIGGLMQTLKSEIVDQPIETLKLGVPAGLYTLQNNLLYVAVSNLEAATFQVTYQMKIITTALFSVLMLSKKLTKLKWVALVMLMAGVAAVQINPSASSKNTEGSTMVGLVAVTVSCISSGFAGVYFEKILKGSRSSVWLRNVQLGMFGTVLGLVGVFLNDGKAVKEHGFMQGFSPFIWVVVANQALGGLLVAVVVKYADNILKGFATSLAIILSSIAAVWLFDFHITLLFTFGATLVITAVYLYSIPDAPQPISTLPTTR